MTGHLMLMLSRPLNMEQTSQVLSELRNNFMNNPITAMGQTMDVTKFPIFMSQNGQDKQSNII